MTRLESEEASPRDGLDFTIKTDGDDIKFLTDVNRFENIARIAAGGDRQGNIPLFSQRLYLFGKNFFVVIVIGDAGKG